MKIIPIILLAIALTACGRKPDAQVQVEVEQDRNAGCQVVTILFIDGETTFMEVDGAAQPHARIARSGKWGNPGDRFRFCE